MKGSCGDLDGILLLGAQEWLHRIKLQIHICGRHVMSYIIIIYCCAYIISIYQQSLAVLVSIDCAHHGGFEIQDHPSPFVLSPKSEQDHLLVRHRLHFVIFNFSTVGSTTVGLGITWPHCDDVHNSVPFQARRSQGSLWRSLRFLFLVAQMPSLGSDEMGAKLLQKRRQS